MKTSLLLASASMLAFASSAYAADLMVDGPGPIQYSAPQTSWTGAYIGVFGGYGMSNFDQAITDDIFNGDTLSGNDPVLGVTAGANFELSDGGVVVGIAGDFGSGVNAYDVDYSTEADVQWAASLRGVVGFDAGAFMPYLTAGVAAASVEVNYSEDVDTHTMYGWTAGAGVAYAATENLVLDVQYRYSDYGTDTFVVDPDADVSVTTHQITGGVNWKF